MNLPKKENTDSIRSWSNLQAVVMLVGCCVCVLWTIPLVLAIMALGTFTIYFYSNAQHWQQYGVLGGAANMITLARLAITLICLYFYDTFEIFTIGILALSTTVLDGFDGYLARRFNTASYFGEYFDMETDAFFVLALTILIYITKLAPWWVILTGMLRYLYVVLLWILQLQQTREPRWALNRYIAVLYMASLVGCFLLPYNLYFYGLVVGCILVTFSFTRSFYYAFVS